MPLIEAYVRGPLYAQTIPIPPGAVLRKVDLVELARAMDQSLGEASRSMDWQIEWATETVRGHEIEDLDRVLSEATSNPTGFHASCEADGPSAEARSVDLSLTSLPAIHIAAADRVWLRQQAAVFEMEVSRRFPESRVWPEWMQVVAFLVTGVVGVGVGVSAGRERLGGHGEPSCR